MKTACRSKIDGDEIQKISIKFFEQLPKKGKPVKKNERQQEYTVLATILMEDKSFADCELKVIALGTGTRCLGSKQLSDSGTIINDSHAEIICKRAFQKYLYAELKKYFFKKESSILNFNVEKGIWCLKDEIKFHFFVSQAFCGDASMSFLKEKKVLLNENVEEKESFNFFDEKEMENPFKRQKLLLNFSENLIRGRNDIEKLGFCRTKPGRIDSDPTNSMSCTDKVLKWSTLGLNGSMLSNVYG
ncbi:hypothetical protein HK099_004340 [Clydaea vesicula]|uniref:tRNA-specific adenosine deaminase 1 n=1 Tax=Clydaea vesicula TaxID=447962 RepID=A0AAD5U3T5_9FUNG|nr:hypothetical protein HK099_004340 [Clydaea vesicula]